MKVGDTITIYPDGMSSTCGEITVIEGEQVHVEVRSKSGMFSHLIKWSGWLTLRERDGLPPCAVGDKTLRQEVKSVVQ